MGSFGQFGRRGEGAGDEMDGGGGAEAELPMRLFFLSLPVSPRQSRWSSGDERAVRLRLDEEKAERRLSEAASSISISSSTEVPQQINFTPGRLSLASQYLAL